MKSIWKQDKNDGFYIKDHYYCHLKENIIIDLTLKFGVGNEPKDINDDRLKYDIYKGEKQ